MKNLKLLNRKYLLIILFYLFYSCVAQSQEPIDIWNIEEKKTTKNVDAIDNNKEKYIPQNNIYKMQSQKNGALDIEEDQTLTSNVIKIVGLYDPAQNGLDINMWSKSNGDQIFNILKRINKIELSNDASEILDILFLTNAHYPKINISKDQFIELKSKWLIKNSNLQLIESYLIKNQIIN